MRNFYMRPLMPKIESGLELSRLYEWFGEQNNNILEMNEMTFNYLLGRLNINPNNRILTFDEPQFVYGYRIIISEGVNDFYIRLYDFYELTK